ncbi:hypothetical protein BASA50_007814 [Batrachochytrium salamandrivorans]|uniref:Acid phosphatase n=1 Tax=Batrachochytrium salamandrivorans TaxID=1357716 RepID=A0ABQ8F8X6_9FUNG|nr:hypothetical protein BASA61_010353 [Batrachochytrium salamandrivorans]KAH6592764.1 hypothetical protein BASA50_007814 [Batrachochytrium salamandrivorans]KAJ1336628.1 hypothetical protein BSLG_007410 [Batrachochytrium salamandrivorans]
MVQIITIAAYLAALCIGASNAIPSRNKITPRRSSGVSFDRFGVIVLENRNFKTVINDKYMGTVLRKKGKLLTNYHALTHPSQPNYLAMISGDTSGVFLDYPSDINRKTIVDLLEAKGISWKTYQENYPGDCYTDTDSEDLYYRKHNPFISFKLISQNPSRCAKIVNADQLQTDINNKDVPQYFFYSPNINNDGHDTNAKTASDWLQGFIEPLLANPYFKNTVFLITFDENEWLLPWFNDNQIYSLLVGGPVAPNTSDNTKYTHYSQLATIEARWGLGSLGQGDALANPFNI